MCIDFQIIQSPREVGSWHDCWMLKHWRLWFSKKALFFASKQFQSNQSINVYFSSNNPSDFPSENRLWTGPLFASYITSQSYGVYDGAWLLLHKVGRENALNVKTTHGVGHAKVVDNGRMRGRWRWRRWPSPHSNTPFSNIQFSFDQSAFNSDLIYPWDFFFVKWSISRTGAL